MLEMRETYGTEDSIFDALPLRILTSRFQVAEFIHVGLDLTNSVRSY